jgi:hypothetical protein
VQTELELSWWENLGYGYFPVDEYWKQHDLKESDVYSASYFQKYEVYEKQSCAINDARVAFTELVLDGNIDPILDIGIGSGTFVRSSVKHYGYDVNPAGIDWLKKNGKWYDMYTMNGSIAYTFWDSFEHIKDLKEVMRVAPEYIIMSIPIFKDKEDVLKSKHLRFDEHFHYFTDRGIKDFMYDHGFKFLIQNDMEVKLGRESIGTYAFKRI